MADEMAKFLDDLAANPNVIENDDGTRTVVLTEPIQVKKAKDLETVDRLTFRKARARDWLETDQEKGELGKTYRLAAALSGLSYVNFLSLDGDDANLCAMVAGSMGKFVTGGR